MSDIKFEVLGQIDEWIDSGEYRYSNATHYLKKRMNTTARKLQKEYNHLEEFSQMLAKSAAGLVIELNNREWISVKDRMPPENEYVLLGLIDGTVYIGMHQRNHWEDDNECSLDERYIQYWQKLPIVPLPKE